MKIVEDLYSSDSGFSFILYNIFHAICVMYREWCDALFRLCFVFYVKH